MLAISGSSYSQRPDRKATIAYINQKLAPWAEIDVDGGTIIAVYTDEKGKKIREDRVAAFDLDTTAVYEPGEKLLSVNCAQQKTNCVLRILYMQKIKRDYARLSFVVDRGEDVEGLKKALIHLIRIDSQFRYKDEITFD